MKCSLSLFFAFLLLLVPAIVVAHTGTGACANCHIVHASVEGVTSTPNDYLLTFDCIGCHLGRLNNAVTGLATTSIAAPQVDDSANPLAGGYFTIPNQESIQHSVSDLFPPDSVFTFIPGTATAYAGNQVGCTLCHDLSLGHSAADAVKTGDASSSYRMLNGNGGGFYVAATGDPNYEVGATRNQYDDAASMNLFCASCHGLFHGVEDTDSNGDGTGVWIRHPVDVTTNGYGANYGGGDKALPVGDEGGTNQVMCISCHRPHGSPVNDMLRFTYDGTANLAGDVSQSQGCETCHGVY